MTERRVSDAPYPHDPYELDRLAEELEVRELENPNRNVENSLPQYVPLSHDNPFLTASKFDIEEFLLSRSYTSLPDLRAELREYLAKLKEELVKLINDDYESFISLSTDLRGEGARLERIKWPLDDIKSKISVSRDQLQSVQDAVKEKLDRREALREEKALLQLLLKISDTIARLESLLVIVSSNQETSSSGARHPSANGLRTHDSDNADDRSKSNRAKHLLRVSTEFNQLLYLAEKARAQGCAFVTAEQWRIDRIKSTLTSDLENHFASTLVSLNSTGKKTKELDEDKPKLLSDLLDCMRAYDLLGLWRDAEDVVRREVVRKFVKTTIYPGVLAAPQSPVLPNTPFVRLPLDNTHNTSLPPRTPYTPYTAFQSKENPFFAPNSHDYDLNVCLLDDRDNALAGLFNRILRFVHNDMRVLMEVAERIGPGLKTHYSRLNDSSTNVKGDELLSMHDDGSADQEDGRGFNILSEVVWAEVARAISDDLGNIVFAVGKPDDFRKNYETTQAFIRSLEYLAPSLRSVEIMRAHPTFAAFERRWQLPVYFQLQWKSIVLKVEEAMETTALTRSASAKSDGFSLQQTAAIWRAVCQCWSSDVYLPDLSHRFWRLTLQLLKRYKVWLDTSLSSLNVPEKDRLATQEKLGATPNSTPRTSTPVSAQDSQNTAGSQEEDVTLQQCAIVLQDVRKLEKEVLDLWRNEINNLLPVIVEELSLGAEAILSSSLSQITDVVPLLTSAIETVLIRRCCDGLAPVKSLSGQFRAASNKSMPTRPSPFVPMILRPVKTFFGVETNDADTKLLRDDFCAQISSHVVDAVANRYTSHVSAMRKNDESLRRLKMGRRTGFSLFGNSSANADEDNRDEERVRTQLLLDVQAFGKDAMVLGVDLDKSIAYKTLNYLVHSKHADVDPSS